MTDNKDKLKDEQLKKVEGGWGTRTETVYYFNIGDCFHDDRADVDFKILDDYSKGVSGITEVHCRYRYNMNGNILENNVKANIFEDFSYKGKDFYKDL